MCIGIDIARNITISMHIELNINFYSLQLYCISASSPCFIVDSYHNTKEHTLYYSLHIYLIVQFQYECLNSIQWETTLSTRVQWKYLIFSLDLWISLICKKLFRSPLPLSHSNHTQWFSFMYFVLKLESHQICSFLFLKLLMVLDCLMFPFIDLIIYFFISLLM